MIWKWNSILLGDVELLETTLARPQVLSSRRRSSSPITARFHGSLLGGEVCPCPFTQFQSINQSYCFTPLFILPFFFLLRMHPIYLEDGGIFFRLDEVFIGLDWIGLTASRFIAWLDLARLTSLPRRVSFALQQGRN